MELARLFERRRHANEPAAPRPAVMPLKWSPWKTKTKFSMVDLQPLVQKPEGVAAWADFEDRMAKFWSTAPMADDQWKRTGGKFLLWQGSEVEIAGVTFRTPVVNGYARPVVVTPAVPEVEIPVGLEGSQVHILGQVTLPAGYPVVGRRGEAVAVYSLRYASGKSREIPLRNGYEVAQSNLIAVATRIDPQATEAQRALVFTKDVVREQYQVLLYSFSLEGGELASLRCQLRNQQSALAIFAITVEPA
jgi:hypothetical protein